MAASCLRKSSIDDSRRCVTKRPVFRGPIFVSCLRLVVVAMTISVCDARADVRPQHRLSRQDVELAPIELTELIQDIVLLTPALQDDVLVVHPPLHRAWGQRTLLQQCLSNLFDNAHPGMVGDGCLGDVRGA